MQLNLEGAFVIYLDSLISVKHIVLKVSLLATTIVEHQLEDAIKIAA